MTITRQTKRLTSHFSRREMLALFGAGAAGIMFPASAFAQAEPKRGGIFRISNNFNPSSLDPTTGGSGSDHSYLYTLYDTLTEWDYDTLRVKPGLADSWSYTDSNTLVLKLRSGVTFHDGTAFDANTVKINLDRSRTDARSNIKADVASIKSVEVSGPMEVTLRLSTPDTMLPGAFTDRAGMMVSAKAIQSGENLDRSPVGSGAYTFVRWGDGEKVVVKRNEKYWKTGRPYPDGIEFSIIPEVTTGMRSVMAGQNDFLFMLPARQKAIVERSKKVNVVLSSSLSFNQFYLNWVRPPFNDIRVRQALNYAVDRQAYSDAAFAGLAEPAHMALPKSHWAYDPSLANLYPHDTKKARQLLSDAGYGGGLEVEFVGTSDQETIQREEVLIEMLARSGIKAKFINGPAGTFSRRYFGTEQLGAGLLSNWTGRPDASQTFAALFSKGSYYNAGRAEVPQALTDAIRNSHSVEDPEERRKHFATAMRLAMENAFHVPLVFHPIIFVTSARVHNFRTNLLGKPKFEDVWLDT